MDDEALAVESSNQAWNAVVGCISWSPNRALHLAAFCNHDVKLRLVLASHRGYVLDFAHREQRLVVQKPSKHDVLVVKPFTRGTRNEELAPVRILALVCLVPTTQADRLASRGKQLPAGEQRTGHTILSNPALVCLTSKLSSANASP